MSNLLQEIRENPIHKTVHLEEMRQIAHETIQKEVPQIVENIYNSAIKNLIGAIQYDIRSIIDISVNDFKEMIFHDEKYSKFVSDAICKELQSNIDKYKLDITF